MRVRNICFPISLVMVKYFENLQETEIKILLLSFHSAIPDLGLGSFFFLDFFLTDIVKSLEPAPELVPPLTSSEPVFTSYYGRKRNGRFRKSTTGRHKRR